MQSMSASPESLATVMKNNLTLTSVDVDEARFRQAAAQTPR
jgi:hypothetical protein